MKDILKIKHYETLFISEKITKNEANEMSKTVSNTRQLLINVRNNVTLYRLPQKPQKKSLRGPKELFSYSGRSFKSRKVGIRNDNHFWTYYERYLISNFSQQTMMSQWSTSQRPQLMMTNASFIIWLQNWKPLRRNQPSS